MRNSRHVTYPRLEGAIAERGILKYVIAETLGISPKAFTQKLHGKSALTFNQASKIQSTFFSDIPPEELFTVASPKKAL